jgi:hypothetical protein
LLLKLLLELLGLLLELLGLLLNACFETFFELVEVLSRGTGF